MDGKSKKIRGRFYKYYYGSPALTRGDRLILASLDLFDTLVTLFTFATVGSNFGTPFRYNRSERRFEQWNGKRN